MFGSRKSQAEEDSNDADEFSCRSIEQLSRNCYGFFRGRAYNHYYYGSSTSQHCDILKTMNSLCGSLQRDPSNISLHDNLIDAKKDYVKLLEDNFISRTNAFKENDVWKKREKPIQTWKTKAS